ncbi:hypothetical protein EDB86DRAFT_2993959 [Lactarius hatsudake]|nr:hypothetical protein EDB86DRAFT_2993959 [Lactarius hatsudake]
MPPLHVILHLLILIHPDWLIHSAHLADSNTIRTEITQASKSAQDFRAKGAHECSEVGNGNGGVQSPAGNEGGCKQSHTLWRGAKLRRDGRRSWGHVGFESRRTRHAGECKGRVTPSSEVQTFKS